MKRNFLLIILSLSSMAFAADKNDDLPPILTLLLCLLFAWVIIPCIIGAALACLKWILIGIADLISELFDYFKEKFDYFKKNIWVNMTYVGKAIVLGIPLFAISYFLTPFVFYTIIPIFYNKIIKTFFEWSPIISVIFCISIPVIFYISCWFIGWFGGKRKGKIAFICRIIFITPFIVILYPIIYPFYYCKEILGIIFIKNYKANWKPGWFLIKYI